MLKSINRQSMNKKGQITIGVFVGTFIAILVGVILMDASADEVGRINTLTPVVNESITAPANGSAHTFTGFKEISSVVLSNYTNSTAGSGSDIAVLDTDYKIINNVIVNGAEVSQIVPYNPDFAVESSARWNVSYTGTPDTYISSGGARSIAGLILVFFALAIAVVALSPTLRSRLLDSI